MFGKLSTIIEGSPALRYGTRVVITGMGFGALLWVCGWVVRPDLEAEPPHYSRAELRAAAELRDNSIAADDRPRIQVEVDYSEGPAADWYPKGESPLLTELVEAGRLPPVRRCTRLAAGRQPAPQIAPRHGPYASSSIQSPFSVLS